MRNWMVCLAAVALLAPGVGAATAQQAVTIDGQQAIRVVIAPPDSPVAHLIKDRLNAAYYGADPSSRAYDEAQKLYYFYGARHFDPIWLDTAPDGTSSFSPNARKLIEVFRNAGAEGFRPADYLTPDLDVAAAGSDPQKLAGLETAFSAAALRYAHDAYMGRVAPEAVSAAIDPETKHLDAADILMQLATSADPAAVMLALDPTDREFAALKAALATMDSQSPAEASVVIPEGPSLKPGMTDERVALLRQRLKVPTPEAGADSFDPALVEAVKAFQGELGITVDGIVGPATVAALNNGGTVSRDDIIANMERWRWLPHDLGAFHVLVNIPEFRLAVVQDDKTTYTTRVVVGKPSTPTPIFSNSIKEVVVNPYWNVPASIVAKEIAPHMLANPGYIESQNMEVVYNGRAVDPYSVDWSSRVPYSIRQRPGRGNALGNIKFLFPNQHDVYLHDTPSKSLFGNDIRAYSHGCVRVQNPLDFANALLKYEPSLDASRIEAMFGPTERWLNLKTHVPVHIAYFTLRVDADGTIRSYGDIYGHNRRLIDLLAGKAAPAAPVKTPIVSGV